MKKLLILTLVLAMALSLVACKSECEKNGHCDADINGLCDECQSITIDYEAPDIVGTILRKSFERQLSEIQSFKFEFNRESNDSSTTWNTDYVEGVGDVLTEIASEQIYRQRVEMWVSRNGDSFDVKLLTEEYIFYKETDSDGYFSDYENDYDSVSYVIDGYLYSEITDGTYTKQPLPVGQLDEILNKLSSEDILSKDNRDELLNTLGAEVATILKLKDNAGSINVDLKGSLDGLLAYIAALDFETDTVGKVLNDALAVISEDLTAEAIITELELLSALTVNAALAELDAWLTENYGTTVQGIIDSLVGSPELLDALKDIAIMTSDVDLSEEELNELIDSTIEGFKSFNLADFIAENELGALSLYELFASYADSEMPTKDDFFTGVRAIMDMTLGQFDENVANGMISRIQAAASYIKVEALDFSVDVKFENILELSELSGAFNLGITTASPSYVEDKINTSCINSTVSFKLYDISEEPIAIALEEDAEIFDCNLIDGLFTAENGWVEFDSYVFDDDVYVDVSGEYTDPENGYVIEFTAWSVPVHRILADEIIINSVSLKSNDIPLDINGPDVLRLTVDVESGTLTFVNMPDYVIFSTAYMRFLELAANNKYDRPTDGYSMVAGAVPSGDTADDIYIEFTDYPLAFIYFSLAEGDDDYTLVCTLTGFGVDVDHIIYHPTDGSSGYGGFYDSDPEAFSLFFGGDLTFEIVLDPETGVFSFVEYPMIEDQYKKNWSE